jgi:hypothetical protein
VLDSDLLTPAECSFETVRLGDPLSSSAIAAAVDRGALPAVRTPSGRRLIARTDLIAFIKARRGARRGAQQPQPAPAGTAVIARVNPSSPVDGASRMHDGGVRDRTRSLERTAAVSS